MARHPLHIPLTNTVILFIQGKSRNHGAEIFPLTTALTPFDSGLG